MPIARVSARKPAKRKTASQKKAIRPASYCADPLHVRCYKQPVHFGYCGTHADAHMNVLLRRVVVLPGSACEGADWHAEMFSCRGDIQVNHLLSRGNYLVRWHLGNVMPGCAKLNEWAHYNKDRWARMIRDWRGPDFYKAIEDIAFSKAKPDWETAHRELHAALSEECATAVAA